MAEQFLLPCRQCQHPIKVEARHAGQAVSCPQCKATSPAPTLRGIQALPRAAEVRSAAGPPPRKRRIWTATSKAVFVVGMFLVVGGIISGGMQFYRASKLETSVEPYTIEPELEQRIAQLTPLETLGLWQQELTRLVPDQWDEPVHLKQRRLASELKRIGIVSFGAAVLGALIIAASILWVPRR